MLLTDPNGHVIATLSQGEAFGEMALLGNRLRNATVKALRETKLLVIDAQSFQRLLELDSTFRTKVHDMARERSLANLKEAHLDSSAWASAYRTSLAHKTEPKHDESVAAGRGVGLAIIFGNILDTIPGCLVIGAKFAGFESMSATLMVGMFLGGIPESAASATLLRRAGFSSAKIYGHARQRLHQRYGFGLRRHHAGDRGGRHSCHGQPRHDPRGLSQGWLGVRAARRAGLPLRALPRTGGSES